MASNLFVSVNARREQPVEAIVPVIQTLDCVWNSEMRTLVFHNARNFPAVIDVVSSHTGVVLRFVQDHDRAKQCEWWDGEMYEYKCHESDITFVVMKG